MAFKKYLKFVETVQTLFPGTKKVAVREYNLHNLLLPF